MDVIVILGLIGVMICLAHIANAMAYKPVPRQFDVAPDVYLNSKS